MIDQCSNDTESVTYLFAFWFSLDANRSTLHHHHRTTETMQQENRGGADQRLLLTARYRAKCRLKTQLAAC